MSATDFTSSEQLFACKQIENHPKDKVGNNKSQVSAKVQPHICYARRACKNMEEEEQDKEFSTVKAGRTAKEWW